MRVDAIQTAVAVASLVLFLSTRDSRIFLASAVTIGAIVVTVIGVLVLLEWELNVLESMTITLAVGLSIDFVIHLGVAFKLSRAGASTLDTGTSTLDAGTSTLVPGTPTLDAGTLTGDAGTSTHDDRLLQVLRRVGMAVTMVSLTTFLAGLSMTGARIKSFKQLGVFLMLIMGVSWVYAVFFFLPLLALISRVFDRFWMWRRNALRVGTKDSGDSHNSVII